MFVLPNNEEEEKNNCFWVEKDILINKCNTNFGTIKSVKMHDVNTSLYESSKNISLQLLSEADNILSSQCNEEIRNSTKIVLHTNFAEKALINSHLIDEFENVNIVTWTIFSANYYFYRLKNINNLYYLNINYLNKILEEKQPIIYLFAISNKLDNYQSINILDAVKAPLKEYDKNNGGNWKLNIMLLASSNRLCYFLDSFFLVNFYLDVLLEEAKHTIIQNQKSYLSAITELAVNCSKLEILGFDIPDEIENNISYERKKLLKKPFLVLITDVFEEDFVKFHLPDQNKFNFKIYALKQNIRDSYLANNFNFTYFFDPQNPYGNIYWYQSDEENFEKQRNASQNNSYTIINWPILIIPVAISFFIGLAAVFVIVLIRYRRCVCKLLWLNKLEQLKTEHIYTAYQNIQNNKKVENNWKEVKEKIRDCWELDWDQIIFTSEQLGKGSFGEVRKGILTKVELNSPYFGCQLNNIREGSPIAVKILSDHLIEQERQNFLCEMEIMKLLRNSHRCIVQMIGCISIPDTTLGLVLEFCSNGNLLNYLRKLSEEQQKLAKENKIKIEKENERINSDFMRFSWQICDGMKFLSEKQIIHRDLAARNILLDDFMVAKISDFGLCIFDNSKNLSNFENPSIRLKTILNNREKGQLNEKLPLKWLAPESLSEKKFSEKSDVWSYGILLHEIYTYGKNPFDAIERISLLEQIIKYKNNIQKPSICPKEMFAKFFKIN
uniref:Protein kinase domain-containing protein n=4 Tax=Meloidogyne enterolobii TaxID=390850 RepID=A0A6V7XF20_MELEN|nr:unnamed protein product [Meloidogyne enterolobii]